MKTKRCSKAQGCSTPATLQRSLHSIACLALGATLVLGSTAVAANITGTVREVNGDTATVAIEGVLAPAVGDGAEIFFKLAGADDEISVGEGTVLSSEGTAVKVKIQNATGEVTKDQLVRFVAGKGARPVSSATPPSAPAAPEGGGFIGAQLSDPPANTSGANVYEVVPDGPAARAGIQPNDLIVALDGSPVESPKEVADATAQLTPGSRHALLVSRAGKLQKIELTIGARPAVMPEPAALPAPEETAETGSTPLPPSVPFPSVAPTGRASEPVPNEPSGDAIAAAYVTRGNTDYAAGRIDSAVAAYSEGIRAAPKVATLYLNRANAYLYKPNFNAAIADANKAIELKSAKLDDAYTIRGTAKSGLGDLAAGIADCNRALKINPRHALAYNNRANNKLRQGNYQAALADCNRSISLDANSALPYYNRGYVYVNTGNKRGALADWKTAVRMQPSFGSELNPKIAQLEAQGAPASPPKAPAANGAGDWVDLTNAPQKIVGTWQGGRHRTRYFSDGTFVTDPHLVPDPPRGQWQVQGDRLVEFFPQANQTVTHQILSLDSRTLVIRNAAGETFRLTRLK